MRRLRAVHRSRRGFTLIEVLSALVLISVIVALSMPLFTSSVLGTVAQDDRLDAVEQLSSELQGQLDSVLASYQGGDFVDAPAAITTYFGGVADISVSTQWVSFSGAGGALSEASSVAETDHLRVDLVHAGGARLSFVISNGN